MVTRKMYTESHCKSRINYNKANLHSFSQNDDSDQNCYTHVSKTWTFEAVCKCAKNLALNAS